MIGAFLYRNIMTKKELIACIPDAKEIGLSVAPLIMLSIYTDEEEVPEEMVRLFLRAPEEPGSIVIFMGHELREAIDEE